MKKIISQQLKMLGVPANVLGYEYLREAVALVVEDKTYVYKITQALYPEVAKRFNTTPSKVERAIRHAIDRATLYAPLSEWAKVFGNSVSTTHGKHTNSVFIAGVADYITLECEDGENASEDI